MSARVVQALMKHVGWRGDTIGWHLDLGVAGSDRHFRRALSLHAAFRRECGAWAGDLVVEINDPVMALVERPGWADGHAGSVFAVVAPHHRKVASGVRKLALLDVLDPGTEDAHRHFVLHLAGDGAGMAADALPLIDDEPVVHA